MTNAWHKGEATKVNDQRWRRQWRRRQLQRVSSLLAKAAETVNNKKRLRQQQQQLQTQQRRQRQREDRKRKVNEKRRRRRRRDVGCTLRVAEQGRTRRTNERAK